MTTKGADEATSGNELFTIAELPYPSGSAATYEPIRAYAKAAQYAATEPATGYSPWPVGAWQYLYAGQTNKSYPSSTPYKSNTVWPFFAAPSTAHRPGFDDRRVLNVPLLSCPVPAGSNVPATAVAVGKFFMTQTATPSELYAEFAGVIPLAKVTGAVELFR